MNCYATLIQCSALSLSHFLYTFEAFSMPNSLSHFHCPSVYIPVSLYTPDPDSLHTDHSIDSTVSSVSPLTGIVPIHNIHINTNHNNWRSCDSDQESSTSKVSTTLSWKCFPTPETRQQKRQHPNGGVGRTVTKLLKKWRTINVRTCASNLIRNSTPTNRSS